jgi:hypothetical protein
MDIASNPVILHVGDSPWTLSGVCLAAAALTLVVWIILLPIVARRFGDVRRLTRRRSFMDVLLGGAGVAQFVTDLRHDSRSPKGTGPWLLPRRWDRPVDRITITLGTKPFRSVPSGITPAIVVRAVITTPGLLAKNHDEVRADVAFGLGAPPRAW